MYTSFPQRGRGEVLEIKKRNVLAGNGLHRFTSLRVSNPALFSAPNKASKGQVSSRGFQGLVSRAYVPAATDEGWARRALSSTQRRQTGRGERQGEWGRRAEKRGKNGRAHSGPAITLGWGRDCGSALIHYTARTLCSKQPGSPPGRRGYESAGRHWPLVNTRPISARPRPAGTAHRERAPLPGSTQQVRLARGARVVTWPRPAPAGGGAGPAPSSGTSAFSAGVYALLDPRE